MTTVIEPGLYQHYKGPLYRVSKVATHSESEELMVVYQALYGDKSWWVRPLSMFDEWVTKNGQKIRRFQRCEEQTLSLEHVVLNVRGGEANAFETAFAKACPLIQRSPGYLGHELRRNSEHSCRYLFTVYWKTKADHEQGFRQSDDYQKWRELLHHFYQPMPEVEHYGEPLNLS